jgi:hypothetical protein
MVKVREWAMPAKFLLGDAKAEGATQLKGAWPMVESAMPQAEARGGRSEDRDMARALVDAGYMPLADYVALYGEDATAGSSAPAIAPAMSMTAQFPAAFARRQTYRATSVRCTFTKPSPRLTRWERRRA